MNILVICPSYILPSDIFEMGKIIMVKVWSLTRNKVIEEDMIIQKDNFRI